MAFGCTCGSGVRHSISIQPVIIDYCVVRGDSFSDTIVINESPAPGVPPIPADLTNPQRTYRAEIRKNANSPEVVAVFTIDMANAAQGEITFSLPSMITAGLNGTYVYDVEQMIDPNPEPRTIIAGTFTFTPDVTKAP